MSRRMSVPLLTLLAASFLFLASAQVAGATHIAIPDPPGVNGPPHTMGPLAAQSTCTLQSGTPTTFSWAVGPPDVWSTIAWRIPLHSCTACPQPTGLTITSASFEVRWPGIACNAVAEVSVVGTTGDPACPTPDLTKVLCAPVDHPITATANNVIYTVPLPGGCCISQDAFLVVRFFGFDACANTSGVTPALRATTEPCVNCDEFYSVLAAPTTLNEWCYPGGTPVWLQLTADCCSPTPTCPSSWGKVKMMYR